MGPAEALGGACKHLLRNRLRAFQHFMIPESDHRPSACLKIGCSDDIVRIVEMLLAINFNNQLGAAVREICDIGSDDELPCEPWAVG